MKWTPVKLTSEDEARGLGYVMRKVGVEDSGDQRQQLDDEPSPSSLHADYGCECVRAVKDDADPGSDDVDHIDEVTSPVVDAGSRSRDRKYDSVIKRCPSECVADCPCSRRRRSTPAADHAAELFPVPVLTSSVTCRGPRASSSVGVRRLLLLPTMWLPWLLSMTSFGLAAALPVDSDASRVPVKVFDGSGNNADVDGPVTSVKRTHKTFD